MNYEKNIKILTDFEKALGNGQPVNFEIKDPDGELKKVSKEEFANWMTEGKEEKNIKVPPKESLVYGVKWDIDGSIYFTERKGKDGFFKESYYEPRSEEEKKRIIERNRKRREQENTQTETSPNSDKKDQKLEKETNQQSSLQGKDNNQNVYYEVGVISLVFLLMSMIVV